MFCILVAHGVSVHQSTLATEQGQHAAPAPTYLCTGLCAAPCWAKVIPLPPRTEADVFGLHFNEDLSAFSGYFCDPTVAQTNQLRK